MFVRTLAELERTEALELKGPPGVVLVIVLSLAVAVVVTLALTADVAVLDACEIGPGPPSSELVIVPTSVWPPVIALVDVAA